jgi:hypothetical protein
MVLRLQVFKITASHPEITKPTSPKDPAFNYTRRYSFALFGTIPIVDAVQNAARKEGELWRQEADFYRRRGGEALSGVLPSSSKGSTAKPKKVKQLDAEFAAAMLDALLRAAGPEALLVQKQADALALKELPFFKEAGTCGHCGTKTGPSALKDKDWFDFQAYIRSKALVKSCGGASPVSTNSPDVTDTKCIDQLRIAVGDSILQHILNDVDVGEAEAVGISPFRAFSATTADLLSASPELDSIRRGVKALLLYFERKGEQRDQINLVY